MIILDSCHSRWVFDTDRQRFRRVLRGPELELRTIMTEWRPYHELHIEEDSDSFVVVLNEEGSRMLRSWRHRTAECSNCGLSTGELAADRVAAVSGE
jgi:hypothetical protein